MLANISMKGLFDGLHFALWPFLWKQLDLSIALIRKKQLKKSKGQKKIKHE